MNELNPIQWAIGPLRNYAKFSGRASRAEFWWFTLFIMIIYFAGIFALGGTAGMMNSLRPGASDTFAAGGVALLGIFWLALVLPMIGVQVRRLHDTDRSGWWLGAFWLLYVVYLGLAFGIAFSPGFFNGAPSVIGVAAFGLFAMAFFIYSIVLLVFFCLRGTKGPNRYGEDPYGADFEEVFA